MTAARERIFSCWCVVSSKKTSPRLRLEHCPHAGVSGHDTLDSGLHAPVKCTGSGFNIVDLRNAGCVVSKSDFRAGS